MTERAADPHGRPGLSPSGAHRGARAVVVGLLFVAALAACGDDGRGSVGDFTPVSADRLVVAAAFLPSPGFWEGPGDAPTGGFEWGLAHALAERFGIADVEVVAVAFSDLVAGDLAGADLAISQVTPTTERDEVLDFSTPYLATPPGVVTAPGVEARDLFELQQLDWVAVGSSTLTDIVEEQVRPDDEALLVDSRDEALDALRLGRADAMLLDLPVALALVEDDPVAFAVIAQLPGTEGLAVVLPDGSDDLTAVDTAIRAFVADGTIDDLSEEWIGTATSDHDEIPLIRTGG
jgi:ABC-type amino acid transport substrate-binding protein